MPKFNASLAPYSGMFYEVVLSKGPVVYRTFDKDKAVKRCQEARTKGFDAEVVNCLTESSVRAAGAAQAPVVREPVAEGNMEVLVSFDDGEAQHVVSNARGIGMSVAQYIAVTLFNGAGISPDIIEVGGDQNSRWEAGR